MVSAAKAEVLVVDDDEMVCATVARVLSRRDIRVQIARNGEEAIERIAQDRFDAVLTDVRLPGVDGLQLLERVRRDAPDLPVVVMSGAGTIDNALRAIRLGAHDFLEKPMPAERLGVTMDNAVRFGRLARRKRELEENQAGSVADLVGESRAMEALRRLIGKVAPSDGRVLILGENGTGKELVAAAIHRDSPRRDRPFVKLNCAAVPGELIESELFGHERGAFTGAVASRRGRFEQADGGTLFLDEVGDMSPPMQAKLLRVLQEGCFERVGGHTTVDVDVRVIAATHRNLGELVDRGVFREDLYYRLAVVTIHVPPLRERAGDIPLLATDLLARTAAGRSRIVLRPEALEALTRHDWPGNVRELRNLVERLAILAETDEIGADEVEEQLRTARRARRASSPEPETAAARAPAELAPLEYRAGESLEALLLEAERAILRAALQHHGGNKAATARALGVDRSHFHKKLKQLGID